MKDYWTFAVMKQWQRNIYRMCITQDDYMGKAIPEFYETVYRIHDGETKLFNIEPDSAKKVVRMQKDNKRYLLPVEYERELPVVVADEIECQLKPSDKGIYHYVIKVKSMSIPADNEGQTFKEFIEDWNPLSHSSPQDYVFLKIMAIASKYKSVKCCLCSPPATGKNSHFMLLNYLLQKVSRLTGPTPARLYQVVVNSDVVVIDEMTSVKAEHVKEIEGMILQFGDNSAEYMKHSQTVGRQLKEADLVKKSIIFTYNRPEDIGSRATFFDEKWNNQAALKSRYPQFLLKGKVMDDPPVLSYNEIEDILDKSHEQIKSIARRASYWTNNLNKHLHGWKQDMLNLKSRHKSNLAGFIDAVDVYCESQQEFDEWCGFINESLDAYKQMIKEDKKDGEEKDTRLWG